MSATNVLLKPEESVILLVDFQAGLGFGVESMPRQVLIHNAVALARTAVAFRVPVVASTSATRVYSGSLLPALQEALPSVKAIERITPLTAPSRIRTFDTGIRVRCSGRLVAAACGHGVFPNRKTVDGIRRASRPG